MMPIRFGAGSGMVPGSSLSDKVAWLAQHKYGAIEVTGPDLVSPEARADLIRGMKANPSVKVTSACHGLLVSALDKETGFIENRGWLNDDEEYRKQGCDNVLAIMKGAHALVKEAKREGIDLGPIRYVIPFDYAATSKSLPPHPRNDEERARYDGIMQFRMKQFEKSVTWLQQQFEKNELANIEVVIEPLNGYETGKINTLEEGWQFVSRFYEQHPNAPRYFSVMGDLYHMGFEPERRDRTIPQHPDTSYFHIATQSDRRVPAPGFADVGPALRAIRDVATATDSQKVVVIEARQNGEDYLKRLENGARYMAKLAGTTLAEAPPAVGRPKRARVQS
jgi:sugar phosphate isomerase/epimerase